jgi:serine O-acetyltransferase
MLARLAVRPFGTIWDLQNKCKNSRGLASKLYRFLYGWYQFEHGSKIDFRADIGKNIALPFGMRQLVISPEVKIGENATIYPHVVIITDYTKDGAKEFPKIGNNCSIGAGVKIIGGVTIGNDVKIMPNCVVLEDIPDNSIVKSAPIEVENFNEVDTKHYEMRDNKLYYFDGNRMIEVDKG